MFTQYCVIKPDSSYSGVSASLVQGLNEQELSDLCSVGFPEGSAWSKYAGIRSIVVFEFKPGLWAVSYVIIGDGQYALKAGRLRAWIVLMPAADLKKCLADRDWVAKLYNNMRDRFAADPNFRELEANLTTFNRSMMTGTTKAIHEKYGLKLPYSGKPANWLAMEDEIWELATAHLKKTGKLIPFTTFTLSQRLQKPFEDIIVGLPTDEIIPQLPPAIVPSYTRLPLALIGIGAIALCFLLLLLFGVFNPPPPIVTATPTIQTPAATVTLSEPPPSETMSSEEATTPTLIPTVQTPAATITLSEPPPSETIPSGDATTEPGVTPSPTA
jgi:hypothetical protein